MDVVNTGKPLQITEEILVEELARMILEETPDVIDVFNTREEMVEYIREAMAFNSLVAPTRLGKG